MAAHFLLVFSTLVVLLITSSTQAKILLVPAGRYRGTSAKGARHLNEGDVICPRHYGRRGFTLECRGNLRPPVNFFVSGTRVHTEWNYPYYITGKWWHRGKSFRAKFTRYRNPHWETIACRSRAGTYKATFLFSCRRKDLRRQRRGKRTYRRKPKRAPRRRKPQPRPQRRRPKIRKVTYPGKRGCVAINAAIPLKWKLPRGWTRGKNYGGVTYKAGDKFGGTFPRGTAQLHYEFWVPRTAHYGVVLDMGTKHWTEHNDVWLRFGHGGLNLIRGFRKRIRWAQTGFLKAYHNRNGRAKQSFSIDFDPHSFSTTRKLKAWKRYTISLSARSTQLTVYRILLFPCSGRGCQNASPLWKLRLRSCGKY